MATKLNHLENLREINSPDPTTSANVHCTIPLEGWESGYPDFPTPVGADGRLLFRLHGDLPLYFGTTFME